MRRIRVTITSVGALLFVAAGASAAHAHAVFQGQPSGFPVNTAQQLTMNVPHERDDTTYNVGVTMYLASGWQPLACEPKPTWTCSIGQADGRPLIRFAKAAGTAPAEDELFRFSVKTAATTGEFSFPTIQTYNTGESVRWIGSKGSQEPAPILRTLPPGDAPVATVPTTPASHGETTAGGSGASATAGGTGSSGQGGSSSATTPTIAGGGITIPGQAATDATTSTTKAEAESEAATASASRSGSSSSSGAPTAMIVGVIAFAAVATGATLVARRRHAARTLD